MRLILSLLLLIPGTAFAQVATVEPPPTPPDTTVVPVPVEEPASAADVADAPPPGRESGRLDAFDVGESSERRLARGILWIPRIPLEVVAQPVRGLLFLGDRYDLMNLFISWFTSEDQKIAFYPTAFIETGWGLNVGARARFNDVLGKGESIRLRLGFGGDRRVAELNMDVGKLHNNWLQAALWMRLERRDQERFYGYGNGDDDVPPPSMPVDPTTSNLGIGSRFEMEAQRILGHVKILLPQSFAIALNAAILRDNTRPIEADPNKPADEQPIDTYYNTADIPGFGRRNSLYTELHGTWDTRRAAHPLDPRPMHATGGYLSLFVGRHEGFDEAIDVWRIGGDFQRLFPITQGPRAIEIRGYATAVTGDRDEIPFLELPRLGGERVLRGYDRDRFRDRIAAEVEAAYQFALSHYIGASVFVDAGRVYSGFDELTFNNMRVGFGAAIELYSEKDMIVRAELASSIDGGVWAYVAVDPAWNDHPRTERR